MVGYWSARPPPPPSSHCERYPLPLSRKALTRLIMINQSLMRLNPFCGATHSSRHGLVLNLALLPCWTHYINYKYNKIQFKSSLTTFYIQVLFSATDFSFDWVLKCYFWNQVVRYSSASWSRAEFEPAKNSRQWHDVWNRPTFIQRFANSRDNLCSAAPSLLLKINSIFLGEWLPCLVQAAGQTYWLFTVYHKFPEIPVGM